jgi:PAS domain S-box-containing protein
VNPDDATLAHLVEVMADGVIIAAADGTIVYWNAAAQRIFGWSAAEAVGASLDLIIPERQRQAHWDGYQRVIATGETRYGATDLLRVPALHADGERRSIAFTVTLLEAADGTVSGIVAVVRDETQRWSDERELRSEIARLRQAAERRE